MSSQHSNHHPTDLKRTDSTMPSKISRRELIAWVAAGTGAAATSGLLVNQHAGSTTTGAPPPTAHFDAAPPSSPTPPAPTAPLTAATSPASTDARLLVVIEMPGGNDGPSMIVPHGIPGYRDLRPRTGFAADEVLRIDDRVGYAPTLTGLSRRGATVVHGVGSTVPNGSHFEMMNRWWAGNPKIADTPTGWIGRLADVLDDGSSPVTAMSVGSGGHPIIRSARGTTIALPGVDALWTVAGADADDRFMRSYQEALRAMTSGGGAHSPAARVRSMMAETIEFADRLLGADVRDDGDQNDDDGDDNGGYGWDQLGRGLQFAASTFERDLGIRVIHVSMPGDFDTHDEHAATHAELMRQLDQSLATFHTDIVSKGLDDRVAVMTMSEFGRTAHENGSAGLDHGTSSTMLLEGPGLRANRQLGEIPSMTRFDDNGDFLTTVPFDSYLAGVVEHWLGVPTSEVFPTSPEPLDIFA